MPASSAAHSPDRHAAGTGKDSTDIVDRSSSIGKKELAASAALACVLVLGAALAVLDRHPFWFLVALWPLAMVFAIAARGRADTAPFMGCLALATLPFVTAIVGMPLGIEPFPMDLLGFKLLDSVSLFALCLATSSYIGTYTTMRLNRQFVVGLSFVLYVAVLAIRGPIGLYGDLIFQTNHIISNNSFMTNLMVGCFVGLVLVLAINRRLRRASSVGAAAATNGGTSP